VNGLPAGLVNKPVAQLISTAPGPGAAAMTASKALGSPRVVPFTVTVGVVECRLVSTSKSSMLASDGSA
jgi:hypothetical protein